MSDRRKLYKRKFLDFLCISSVNLACLLLYVAIVIFIHECSTIILLENH